jgi:peptide/nickel transport system permease protein
MLMTYILRRIAQTIPTLLGVFTILFVLVYLMPADPIRAVLGEEYKRMPPEVIAAIKEELGIDRPFLEQYFHFLGETLRGNLGRSYILQENVIDIIGYRFPHTLELMIGGMLVALIIGLPTGIFAALTRYLWLDRLFIILTSMGISIPIFWLALLAQLFLTQSKYGIALFPVAGYEDGNLSFLILPSLVLGFHLSAEIARITRASMLEVRLQDYLTTARAKGLRNRTILFHHQLRNALVPIITVITLDVGYLLGGSIITETVFNWPGLGRAIVPAIQRRDTPVILGILMFSAALFIGINFFTDLLYPILDPRIRYSVQE